MGESLILDSESVYRFPEWSCIPWLEHGFGTKLSDNWLSGRHLTTVRQIHSDRILLARHGNGGVLGEGDAMITDQPGVLLAIRTADCLPILIVDRVQRVVANIHAGWRGTAAGIAAKTIESMQVNFGSTIRNLEVVIGPGIGRCCFEVGPDVAQQLVPGERASDGKSKIDLEQVNYQQLILAGVASGQISGSGLCTCCLTSTFYSYRRDREASGRMVTAIGVLKSKARVETRA